MAAVVASYDADPRTGPLPWHLHARLAAAVASLMGCAPHCFSAADSGPGSAWQLAATLPGLLAQDSYAARLAAGPLLATYCSLEPCADAAAAAIRQHLPAAAGSQGDEVPALRVAETCALALAAAALSSVALERRCLLLLCCHAASSTDHMALVAALLELVAVQQVGACWHCLAAVALMLGVHETRHALLTVALPRPCTCGIASSLLPRCAATHICAAALKHGPALSSGPAGSVPAKVLHMPEPLTRPCTTLHRPAGLLQPAGAAAAPRAVAHVALVRP